MKFNLFKIFIIKPFLIVHSTIKGVFTMERIVLRGAMILGVLFIPTLVRKPTAKLWFPFFLFNGILNLLIDSFLVGKKYLKYPKRLASKQFKTNIVYDLLICPYLSVWYCQSSYHSKFPGIIGKLLLFGIPQSTYEIWAARKTDLLKFNRLKWTWVHSLFAVFGVKITIRALLEIPKRVMFKERNQQ